MIVEVVVAFAGTRRTVVFDFVNLVISSNHGNYYRSSTISESKK